MILNALTRIGKTRGVEININLELTKNEKKCYGCLPCHVDASCFCIAVALVMFQNNKEHSVAPSSAQRLPEDRGSLHLPKDRGAGGEVGPEPILKPLYSKLKKLKIKQFLMITCNRKT